VRSEALRFLLDTPGTDRVFFGTNWPFDLTIYWPVSWILSLKSLTQEEKGMILWKKLLGI
jgi:predicted TIM-barrel fold metal-dependent hydrolase